MMLSIHLPDSIPILSKELARMGTGALVVMRWLPWSRQCLLIPLAGSQSARMRGAQLIGNIWASGGSAPTSEWSWLRSDSALWVTALTSVCSLARMLTGWLACMCLRLCVRSCVGVGACSCQRCPMAVAKLMAPHGTEVPLTIADKQCGLCYVTSDGLAVGLGFRLHVGR